MVVIAAAGAYYYLSPSCLKGNCREGFGIKYLSGQYRYEGNFKNGLAEGKGKLVLESGESYDGEWVRGNKEGTGTYVYINGNRYVGSWKSNKPDGEGILYDLEGVVLYKGRWNTGNAVE
ncbi:MORN repeat protein [Leptospira broomii serovar Hurstbridge str. 5399]|uniref:MORN repeat protein n=1 Tax=Leptospira broomii serovar Hurstbridge str. 5399 TaxID=1049789 RepID=T0F9P9_9LEPT|nr:hypothetical protein [Leptospira broomii]EQA44601.1 MORN repeat protein [Leptospira broomii serovar Hurstbridge str. 5399]